MFKLNSIFTIILALILVSFSGGGALAQSSGDGTEAIATSGSEKKPQATYPGAALIEQVISEIVQAVVKGFDDLANKSGFDDVGQTIMYMLLAVMLAWALVKSLFGAGISAFLEEAISLLLVMGIIQLLLWSGGIDGIEKFINSIATNIAGDDLSNLSSTLQTSLKGTFKACLDILTMPSIESNSGWNVAKVLVAIPQTILQVFAKFIAAAFVVLSCGVFVANVVLAYGSIIIAKALAPIMIPWLLLPNASFLFDGWLKFFLGACMFKVVGAFFIKLTDNWITGIATIATKVKVDTDVDALSLFSGNFLVYVAIILMSACSAYLMIMVPSIASGILSGSAARAGFTGVSTLMNGVGGRSISSGYKSGSNGVNAGARGAFNAGQKLMSRPNVPMPTIGSRSGGGGGSGSGQARGSGGATSSGRSNSGGGGGGGSSGARSGSGSSSNNGVP